MIPTVRDGDFTPIGFVGRGGSELASQRIARALACCRNTCRSSFVTAWVVPVGVAIIHPNDVLNKDR